MNHSIKLVFISLLSIYAVGCGSPFTAEEATSGIFTITPEPDSGAEITDTDAGKTTPKEDAEAQDSGRKADAMPIADDAGNQSDGYYVIPPPKPPAPTGCSNSAATIIVVTTLGTVDLGSSQFVCVAYYGSVDGWSAYNIQGWGVNVVGTSAMATGGTSQLVDQPAVAPGADGYVYWNWFPDTSSITASNSSMSLY